MVLLILCLVCVPVLPGICAMKILYGRRLEGRVHLLSAYVTGWMLCICLAGVANVVAVVTGQSLLACTKLFVGLVAGAEVASGVLLGLLWLVKHIKEKNSGAGKKRGRKSRGKSEVAEKGGVGVKTEMDASDPKRVIPMALFTGFLIVVLIQIASIINNGYVYITGDMTLETVQSFLDTDALYQVNPLTGQAYEAGVPLRIKILCLPTLYAMLCELFGISASMMVWKIMPVYHLICSYMVYYLLASKLFGKQAVQRYVFLLLAALILWQGTYAYGMDGLGLLYRGFRGESVRGAILLPYVVWAALERKKACILLAVFVEACIVWTLYGMGACLFTGVGLLLVILWCEYMAKKHGKESALCGK